MTSKKSRESKTVLPDYEMKFSRSVSKSCPNVVNEVITTAKTWRFRVNLDHLVSKDNFIILIKPASLTRFRRNVNEP